MEKQDKPKGYFEGTLQLRNPTKQIKQFVNNEIDKNNIYIADRKKLKNGLDLKVSSNKFLMKLGKKLKESFKGNLKISRKLYSKNRLTSKNIWRLTVKFEHHDIRKGQIIEVNGEKYKVNNIGDKVQCTSIESGKKKLFEYKDIQ